MDRLDRHCPIMHQPPVEAWFLDLRRGL
jgi:hypothetical protein